MDENNQDRLTDYKDSDALQSRGTTDSRTESSQDNQPENQNDTSNQHQGGTGGDEIYGTISGGTVESDHGHKDLPELLKTKIVLVCLLLFFPLGILLMWKWMKNWTIKNKMLITAAPILTAILMTIYVIFGGTPKYSEQIRKEKCDEYCSSISGGSYCREKCQSELPNRNRIDSDYFVENPWQYKILQAKCSQYCDSINGDSYCIQECMENPPVIPTVDYTDDEMMAN